MPLYEFQCAGCGKIFEILVRKLAPTTCPGCGSERLERLPSTFGVNSEAVRKSNLQRARKQNEKTVRDKRMAEIEEITHHDH